MQYGKGELKKNGIVWSSLNGAGNVEVTRLLVNCYKHNDSKIDSASLANVISQPEGEKIRWGEINMKDLIDSCELLVGDLAKQAL